MEMFSPGQLNQILPQGSLQKPSGDDTMVKISEMTIYQPEETIKSSLQCWKRSTCPRRFSISAVMAASKELFPAPTFPITPISWPLNDKKWMINQPGQWADNCKMVYWMGVAILTTYILLILFAINRSLCVLWLVKNPCFIRVQNIAKVCFITV